MRLELNGLYKALTRAGDGVMVADATGRILLWNRSAERLLGWASAEAVGRSCCEVFEGRHENGRGCAEDCTVTAAVRKGEPVETFDLRTRTKAGREVRLNVSTLALSPDNGSGSLAIHLFRDTASRATSHPNGAAREPQANGNGATGPLTPRELEVLRLLAKGANTRMAADELKVSPATIRNHVQNLLGKLGVHSRLQAVAYATAHGLL